MSNLTSNEFSYKMFTAPKTKITEADLIEAIRIFKDYWTVKDLEKSIAKIRSSSKIRAVLSNLDNPLVTTLNSSKHPEAKFVKLFAYDIPNEYLTAEEYQLLLDQGLLINTLIPTNTVKRWTSKEKCTTYLSIIKRMPKTNQTKILIKYLNELLKEYQKWRYLKQ